MESRKIKVYEFDELDGRVQERVLADFVWELYNRYLDEVNNAYRDEEEGEEADPLPEAVVEAMDHAWELCGEEPIFVAYCLLMKFPEAFSYIMDEIRSKRYLKNGLLLDDLLEEEEG